MTDDQTTDTRTRRTFLTALAGVAGVGGVSMAREAMNEKSERTARAFRLSARTKGWRGGTPKAITGRTNPTLELRAGEVYELAWKNASGTAQNFAFRDSNGDYLPVIRTDAERVRGQNITTDTTATDTTETVDNFTRGTVDNFTRGTVDNFTRGTVDGFFNGTSGTTVCPGGSRRSRNRLNDTTGAVGTFTSETVNGFFNDTTDGVFNDSDGDRLTYTTRDGGNDSRGNRLTDTTRDGFFNDTTDGGFFNGTADGGFFNDTTVCPGGRQNQIQNRLRDDNVTGTTTGTTVDSRAVQTDVLRETGAVQRLQFVAVEEMAEYVSTTRPEKLVGAVEVSSGT